MKNEDMLLQLLIKIKDSLIDLADKSTVFSIAYNALKQIDFDDLKSYQSVKDILSGCYKYLIEQESKGQLTLNKRILLNNIDRLDDLLVEGKM